MLRELRSGICGGAGVGVSGPAGWVLAALLIDGEMLIFGVGAAGNADRRDPNSSVRASILKISTATTILPRAIPIAAAQAMAIEIARVGYTLMRFCWCDFQKHTT